jgi:hypothetical protein
VVLGLAFSLPYLQLHDPTLGMLQLAGHEGWLAPSAELSGIVDTLSFHTLGWAVRVGFAVAIVVATFAIAREVWWRAETLSPNGLAAAWGWSLVLFTLLGPVLLPWYVVW